MAGKDDDVKVLGVVVSPFAIRVRIALNLKGVSYEYIEEDIFNKSELLLNSNPVHKKVPVLIHNGKPICESLVIVQYVDEAWAAAPSVLPADSYDRAVARFWAAYVDDKMFPGMAGVLFAATEEERAAKAEETLAAMAQLEKAFAECAGGKAFFGGDTIGYVDLALGTREQPALVRGAPQDVRRGVAGRRQDPALGGVGGAVRGSRGGQGGGAGRRCGGGALQEAPGSCSSCFHRCLSDRKNSSGMNQSMGSCNADKIVCYYSAILSLV